MWKPARICEQRIFSLLLRWNFLQITRALFSKGENPVPQTKPRVLLSKKLAHANWRSWPAVVTTSRLGRPRDSPLAEKQQPCTMARTKVRTQSSERAPHTHGTRNPAPEERSPALLPQNLGEAVRHALVPASEKAVTGEPAGIHSFAKHSHADDTPLLPRRQPLG